MKLLIADDSKPLRESLKARLSDIAGISEIHEAGSCSETLSELIKKTPDLVILDIQLGDGTGFDVLEQLSSKKIKTSVIVFTSFSYPEYREKALSLGALNFISKSDDDNLFDLLENMAGLDRYSEAQVVQDEVDK